MPLSRRDKKVSLTKTLKKGMKLKQQIVEDIRKSLDDFTNLFVFNICNMRHGPMNELREEWKGSRFFLAKRKVMAIALGRTQESEVQKNLHKVAAHVVGECGLLFTNKPKDEVVKWFENYSKMDYAKSGFVAKETVALAAGPLTDFSFSMEPQLRALGLPTQLEKGTVVLREDFIVCRAGARLSPEQAQLLKLFGKPMAEFKITLLCVWTKDSGTFEKIKIPHELIGSTPSKLLEKSYKKTSSKKQKESSKGVFKESSSNLEDFRAKLEETQNNELELTKKSPVQVKKSIDHSSKLFVQEAAVRNGTDVVIEGKELANQTNKHKQDTASPRQTRKRTSRTPKNMFTQTNSVSKKAPLSVEKSMSKDGSEKKSEEGFMQVGHLKVDAGTPRRSLRTPKPIKRTPEQKKLSVKKLTESSKSGTPKHTTPASKRQNRRKSKPQIESEDIEMND